jgi:diaminohydroxyphosphoribosylaminopyrimidine deaminase/5-amino-6-(5-phosphoribosylamino)uracil reductase
MQRALDLAGLGLGKVSPNPMVGCVIVHDDRIIGEGWHRQYGGAHAEVNAIQSIKEREILSECTLYVNLEPCSHHGKTPPCADLIIASGVKIVIIANQDPNPLVSGKGIMRLQQHGVEVKEGVLKEAGDFINRRFFTYHQKQRPYIVLKWAQTSDGYIARTDYDSKWISNEYSRQLVHQYRAREDAVMVGRITAHYDDPELTVRHWTGRNPLRVVLDRQLTLAKGLKLFDGSVPTLCYNFVKHESRPNLELIKIPENGSLEGIWQDLYRRQVQSLLVEGGAQLLSSLIGTGYWDEARVFTAPVEFGQGIGAPAIPTSCTQQRIISGDVLRIYFNNHAPH